MCVEHSGVTRVDERDPVREEYRVSSVVIWKSVEKVAENARRGMHEGVEEGKGKGDGNEGAGETARRMHGTA